MVASYSEVVKASLEVFKQYDTSITLRQLYYRLVSRHLIPNTINSYKRLSRLLVKARETGDVPVNCLEDRSRRVLGRGDSGYTSAEDYLRSKLDSLHDSWKGYSMPMWEDQPRNMIISLEKDALSRLVSRVATGYSVRTFPTRGYPSFSFVRQMAGYIEGRLGGKHTIVLYFGDFDPSGVDIERDLKDRLEKYGAEDFSVRRVALTSEQIREHSLPPMPVKRSDARSDAFLISHGDRAVELDALDPNLFQGLVKQSIVEQIDTRLWNERVRQIKEMRQWIKSKLEDIDKVIDEAQPLTDAQ